MWEPVALPYKSSTATITLPTTEEIRTCTNLVHERFASKIVALNGDIIVKFGRDVEALEGQALIYLEQHIPEVPAPRLYAMYHESNDLFVVMQRVPGVTLEKLWPSLTGIEKDSIMEQLRHVFDRLRQAVPPGPQFFGGLDKGSVRHYLFYSQSKGERYMGPFCDESAFVRGLTDNYRALKENNKHPDFKARFYESHLLEVLKGMRPVLTHGDIHRKNIMIAEKGKDAKSGVRLFDVVLVDWEMSGWLPEFWEYFCASVYFRLAGWDDDWCWRVGHVLPVQLAKTSVMQLFERDAGL